MPNNITAREILGKVVQLCEQYSKVYRGNVSPERYKRALEEKIIKDGEFDDELVRESLVEHVGYLPIIASTIYPYLEHKDSIDLGKVLIMLSIHDIGETVTGDIITYHKNAENEKSESQIAKELLHPSLMAVYEEYERKETLESKFAHSVDKMEPLIQNSQDLEMNYHRWKHHNFGLSDIVKKKRDCMRWDKVMLDIFDCWVKSAENS